MLFFLSVFWTASSNKLDSLFQINFGKITASSVSNSSESSKINSILYNHPEFWKRKISKIEKEFEKSPYYKKIEFENVSGARSKNASGEYLILKAKKSNRGKIRVDGWKVFEVDGGVSYLIPKAIERKLPVVVQKTHETLISPGNIIILSTGTSPIGYSFKIHKCLGYREQFKNFYPKIKASCPTPNEELLRDTSVSSEDYLCAAFVDRIRNCTATTRYPNELSSRCKKFIKDTFTEENCIKKHHQDPNFVGKEWRLFLRNKEEIWTNDHSILILLDQENRLVDYIQY